MLLGLDHFGGEVAGGLAMLVLALRTLLPLLRDFANLFEQSLQAAVVFQLVFDEQVDLRPLVVLYLCRTHELSCGLVDQSFKSFAFGNCLLDSDDSPLFHELKGLLDVYKCHRFGVLLVAEVVVDSDYPGCEFINLSDQARR